MTRSNAILLVASLSLSLAAPAWAEDEGSQIRLSQGTQKVLTVPGIERIAIGNPSVVDIKTIGSNQVLMVGMAEGTTSLMIWRSNGSRVSYNIKVRKGSEGESLNEISKLLGDREGIVVHTVGDRVIIEGQAYTAEDADRVAAVVSLYPDVVNLVKMAPKVHQVKADQVNYQLQKAGFRDAKAVVVGDTIFLEGSVESTEERQRAELIARSVLDEGDKGNASLK